MWWVVQPSDCSAERGVEQRLETDQADCSPQDNGSQRFAGKQDRKVFVSHFDNLDSVLRATLLAGEASSYSAGRAAMVKSPAERH